MRINLTLTWTTPTDYPDLADVMFDAVRNGSSLYTEAQRVAWVPARPSTGSGVGAEWEARLARQVIAVARDADRITGFMTIEPGGYIDFAYIRPEAPFDPSTGSGLRITGLFRRLFGRIEEYPKTHVETRLWIHAA